MRSNHLLAVEALLRNSHEPAVNAREEAAQGRDTVLQQRLETLAKGLKGELTTIRAAINSIGDRKHE
jgi:hypothetical protein